MKKVNDRAVRRIGVVTSGYCFVLALNLTVGLLIYAIFRRDPTALIGFVQLVYCVPVGLYFWKRKAFAFVAGMAGGVIGIIAANTALLFFFPDIVQY